MSILVICECGAQLRTSEAHAGKTGRCPSCGKALVCPGPAAPTPPAPPPPPPPPVVESRAGEPMDSLLPPPSPPEPEEEEEEEEEAEAEVESGAGQIIDSLLPPPPPPGAYDDDPEPEPEPTTTATATATPADGRPRRKPAEPEAAPAEPWTVVRSFQAHRGVVTALTFNPDGRLLATAGEDKTVKVFDLASGQAMVTLGPLPHVVGCLSFSPDGKRLAGGSSRPRSADAPTPNVWLWDLRKREALLEFPAHRESVLTVAFGGQGELLVTGGDCLDEPDSPTLSFWDSATGEPLSGHRIADTSEVREVVRSLRGDRIAAACWQTITLWDALEHKLLTTVNSGSWDQFHSVTLSPDGKLVAGGCYEYIRVWDLTTSHTLGHLTGYNADITSVSFCPDSAHLAGVSVPDSQWEAPAVKMWDVVTHQERANLESPTGARIVRLQFAPKRKLLATADEEGAICLWVLAEGH